jgi:hypothetical protein
VVSSEDRHAVPGTLALPDRTIAKGSKGMCRKRQLLGLELLEANDVWLRFSEPSHEVVQAFVDVESDDLQSPGLNLQPIVISTSVKAASRTIAHER